MSVSPVPLWIGSRIAATSWRPRAKATASKTPNVVVNPAESRSALGGSPQAFSSPQPIPFPGSPGAKPLNPSIPRAAIFHREAPPFSTGLNNWPLAQFSKLLDSCRNHRSPWVSETVEPLMPNGWRHPLRHRPDRVHAMESENSFSLPANAELTTDGPRYCSES